MDLIPRIKEKVTIQEALSHFGVEVPPRCRDPVMTRCPWHEDHNPSMAVYRRKGRAWCYACNKGGDIIDITAIFLRYDTKGAVNYWADCLGLSEERPLNPEEERSLRLRAIEERERRKAQCLAREASLIMERGLRPRDASEFRLFDVIYKRKDRLDEGLAFVDDFDALRSYLLGLLRWRITALKMLRACGRNVRFPLRLATAQSTPSRQPRPFRTAREKVLSEERGSRCAKF